MFARQKSCTENICTWTEKKLRSKTHNAELISVYVRSHSAQLQLDKYWDESLGRWAKSKQTIHTGLLWLEHCQAIGRVSDFLYTSIENPSTTIQWIYVAVAAAAIVVAVLSFEHNSCLTILWFDLNLCEIFAYIHIQCVAYCLSLFADAFALSLHVCCLLMLLMTLTVCDTFT